MTGKGTVLVVEDDTLIQDMLTQALEAAGYRVYTPMGGAVPAVARAVRPDVILLDMLGPGLGGAGVSRCLRGDGATAHIPIVAMSTVALEAASAQVRADDWLQKPFHLDELYRVVERWITAA